MDKSKFKKLSGACAPTYKRVTSPPAKETCRLGFWLIWLDKGLPNSLIEEQEDRCCRCRFSPHVSIIIQNPNFSKFYSHITLCGAISCLIPEETLITTYKCKNKIPHKKDLFSAKSTNQNMSHAHRSTIN